MIRISAFVWIIVLGLLGVGLFQVKYNVQSKEAELRGINKQIEANRSAMHVLDAEWSYLNDPTRLADLTRRHTDLTPTQASQLKHFADLPPRPATAQPALPALSSVAPNALPAPAAPNLAPATAAPAAVIPASIPANAVPTASPAVAMPTSDSNKAKAVVPAAASTAAKPANNQATAQPAAKPAAGTVSQPGADEVIDAILADMQRKQANGNAPAAGDQ